MPQNKTNKADKAAERAVDRLAKILWNYMVLCQRLQSADCIIVLGNWDIRTAEWGIDLYERGLAPIILFSGNHGHHTTMWDRPEAEVFADLAIARGVPQEAILVENRSTNTGENIIFSLQLLKERGLDPAKLILVHKPPMERRTYATFIKLAPEKVAIVSSPPISYKDYPTLDVPKSSIIESLVGDMQRLIEYPRLGYTAHQEVPKWVLEAYYELIQLGFTRRLIGRSDS